MFEEADLLPLSGLMHLLFCERRWALIHLERLWEENVFTAEGRVLHEKVDEGGAGLREGIRIARGLPLRSFRLGLIGRADVVEFPPPPEPPFPVEYKRGRPKPDESDEAQLCAQALCLEEMLGLAIPRGALFYGLQRRRTVVEFTTELRLVVERAAARMHELVRCAATPPGRYEKKCRGCSLLELCLPRAVRYERSAAEWLEKARRVAASCEES
jgi:CRISPR-associated exonuclease Cas4